MVKAATITRNVGIMTRWAERCWRCELPCSKRRWGRQNRLYLDTVKYIGITVSRTCRIRTSECFHIIHVKAFLHTPFDIAHDCICMLSVHTHSLKAACGPGSEHDKSCSGSDVAPSDWRATDGGTRRYS